MHSKNQKRHGSPVPSRSPLVPMKPKVSAVAPAVNPSLGDTLPFRVPKDYPHSRFNKAPLAVYPPKGARSKTCVSLPVVSLEKMPCLSRSNSVSHVRLNSSAPSVHKPCSVTPPTSQRSSEKLVNGRGSGGAPTPRSGTSPSSVDGRPSPARSPLDRRPASTTSPSSQLDRKPSPSPSQRCSALPSSSSSTPDKKQQNGTKTSAVRSHRRLSGRVFDPNKHCGVPDPETKRPCTRSLTCKSHSLTQRRAVPGRRKHFNILLAEHKGSAKEKEGAKERPKERDAAHKRKELSFNQSVPPHEASPSKPLCPNGRPLSILKLRLASAHVPRAPTSSSSTPLPPAPTPPSASNPEPSPSGGTSSAGDGGRPSSDEGDSETPEDTDRAAVHFSNQHPQPLGLCIFSSRLMGRGHYVFDRRWDRMRLALQNMVEKHLNSQMWRKVPLAAESLQSPSGFSSSQQLHPPSPLSGSSPVSTPPTNCYTATFPQTTGVFSIRDAPHSHTQTALGKAGNGTHKSSRSSKVTEDSSVGSKKRRNSTFYPFSSLFPAIDNHKRNGNSHHAALQGGGGTVATPARRKELGGGGGGLWSSAESWMSRADGSHNSPHSRDPGVSSPYTSSKDAATAPNHSLPCPSVPLAHSGKTESRKRRSPSSCRGKANKVSRPGELESSFGKGNDGSGILASGPESPRQVKMHH